MSEHLDSYVKQYFTKVNKISNENECSIIFFKDSVIFDETLYIRNENNWEVSTSEEIEMLIREVPLINDYYNEYELDKNIYINRIKELTSENNGIILFLFAYFLNF